MTLGAAGGGVSGWGYALGVHSLWCAEDGVGANVLVGDRTFTDQVDDGSALMSYRAHYYDPMLGGLTQADSLIDGSDVETGFPAGVLGPPVGMELAAGAFHVSGC